MNSTEVSNSLELLKIGQYSDVALDVVGGIQKRRFKCHKIILASKSKVLEKLLKDKDELEVRGIDPDVFYNLLHYVYTDQIKTVSVDCIAELFDYASNLGLEQFRVDYKRGIMFEVKFALYNLEFARKIGDKKREEDAEQFIRKHAKIVLKRSIVDHVGPETVLWLLDQDYLNLNSDFELLEFLAKYRDKVDPTAEFLQKAKMKIRYMNMNKQQLMDFNKAYKILDKRELFYIRKNFDEKDKFWSMPEGYTTSNRKRRNHGNGQEIKFYWPTSYKGMLC